MKITASRTGERIYYDAPPTYFDLLREIPGARFDSKRRQFHTPLSWETAIAARGVLGDALEWGESADDWLWNEKNNTDVILAAKEGAMAPCPDPRLDGYQWVGASYLYVAGQCILGDKMRMGKTVQTLSALEHFRPGKALIVCPNTTKLMWAAEARTWAPSLITSVIGGTKAQQAKALAAEADVYVVGWDLMKKLSRHKPYGSVRLTDAEKTAGPLNEIPFAVTIFDEAHRMVDPQSKQTRAAWYLAHSTEYRWFLTGTLITDTPDGAWGILHGARPEGYPSRSAFIARYCDAKPCYWGGLEIKGLKEETKEEFFRFFDVRFLRRSKADDVSRLTVPVEMGAAQAKAYATMEKHMIAEFDSGILAATDPLVLRTRLLQMAAATPVLVEVQKEDDTTTQVVDELKMPSCKVDALMDLIADRSGPLVVFADSRKLIELCDRQLTKAKVPHGLVTGQVSGADRQEAVRRFQDGEEDVILLTIGAGCEGITLSRSDTVVFLQRSYRNIQNVQAAARVSAVRDEVKPVQIIDVITAGTVEDRVHEIAAAKNSRLQEFLRDPEEWWK